MGLLASVGIVILTLGVLAGLLRWGRSWVEDRAAEALERARRDKKRRDDEEAEKRRVEEAGKAKTDLTNQAKEELKQPIATANRIIRED